jgi:hypothetical protein
MLMNFKAASLLACLVLSGSAAAGLAQDNNGTPQEQETCRPDADRLCSQFGFDVDRIKQCMDDNLCKLTPACQKVILKYRPDLRRCTGRRVRRRH